MCWKVQKIIWQCRITHWKHADMMAFGLLCKCFSFPSSHITDGIHLHVKQLWNTCEVARSIKHIHNGSSWWKDANVFYFIIFYLKELKGSNSDFLVGCRLSSGAGLNVVRTRSSVHVFMSHSIHPFIFRPSPDLPGNRRTNLLDRPDGQTHSHLWAGQLACLSLDDGITPAVPSGIQREHAIRTQNSSCQRLINKPRTSLLWISAAIEWNTFSVIYWYLIAIHYG